MATTRMQLAMQHVTRNKASAQQGSGSFKFMTGLLVMLRLRLYRSRYSGEKFKRHLSVYERKTQKTKGKVRNYEGMPKNQWCTLASKHKGCKSFILLHPEVHGSVSNIKLSGRLRACCTEKCGSATELANWPYSKQHSGNMQYTHAHNTSVEIMV